jgi:hypothetical protein
MRSICVTHAYVFRMIRKSHIHADRLCGSEPYEDVPGEAVRHAPFWGVEGGREGGLTTTNSHLPLYIISKKIRTSHSSPSSTPSSIHASLSFAFLLSLSLSPRLLSLPLSTQT